MNEPPTILPWASEPPASSAELCLYLIMILPEMDTRRLHIKDFCRLYEIREKRPVERENPLNQITNVMRSNPQQPQDALSIIARDKAGGKP